MTSYNTLANNKRWARREIRNIEVEEVRLDLKLVESKINGFDEEKLADGQAFRKEEKSWKFNSAESKCKQGKINELNFNIAFKEELWLIEFFID